MRFVRNSGSSSLVVVLFLLVLLSVFAGPNLLPRFFSSVVPGFDEGVPCMWLQRASDRGDHQSLLGRAAENPIALSVRAAPISGDPSGLLPVSIVVTNTSLGTVPFVFDPQAVIVGDNGTSGVGLIFNPSNTLTTGYTRNADPAAVPEANLKLLQPRQSCVHRVEFPNGNVLIDPAINDGRATVRAYYRNTTRGQILPTPGDLATPIYPDQGLWVGYVESPPVTIGLASP